MAGRPYKVGLDYFDLDCHMDQKVELIEADYGLKGFAILVKLYQSIYAEFGYYCEWSPDISVLWAKRLGCTRSVEDGNVGSVSYENGMLHGFPKNLINEVISASIRRNLFSEELFLKYRILTSVGIQNRYVNATSKRERVELKKEYLLICVGENSKHVVINSIYDGRNSINEGDISQSREEKSKEEIRDNVGKKPTHSKKKTEDPIPYEQIVDYLNTKAGKKFRYYTGTTQKFIRARYQEGFTYDDFIKVIDIKCQKWLKNPEMQEYLRPSTLFGMKFESYLNECNGTFNNASNIHKFKQNDYDFDAIERDMLSN